MNKTLLILWCNFLFLSIATSQNCSSQRYISKVFQNTQRINNIKFGEADPYGIINNQDLFLDIEEPSGDTLAKRPLILHQFGGGFLIGWRNEPVIPQMAEEYAKRGFVFATMDYRLGFNVASGQSAERAVYRAAQDMSAALRFLVDNADLYGIDTSAIFITGTSAGCLSGLVNVFMEESDRSTIPSTFGILLEPADLGCMHCSGNNNFNNQKPPIHGLVNNWGAILDTSFIDLALNPQDNVPVISFHGTNDNIVPYGQGNPFSLPIFPQVQGSLLIHQRLDNQGIKNRLFPLQGLGHEPQLLQLQTWVTDTILRQGSKFLYEIMYGDSIQITGDESVCINSIETYSVPFNVQSQYCWDVTGGTIVAQNVNEISIQWNNAGTHLLKATELDKRHISKEAQLIIEVQNPPNPDISFISNDGLFNFNSSTAANQYTWLINQNDSLLGNPVSYQFTDTGFYPVSLTLNSGYCVNTKDTIIESTICPDANFNFLQNDSVLTLVNNSSFGIANTWIDFDGNVYNTDSLRLELTEENNYSFTLIVSNDFCSDTLTQSIDFSFCSSASFFADVSSLDVSFTNTSFNAYFYTWLYGDGNSSGLENPSHTYDSTGTYEVALITSSIDGCSDTTYQTLTIDLGSSIQNNSNSSISIYPIPTENLLYLTRLPKNDIYTYKLIDLSGKVLANKTLMNNTISMDKLQTGTYILSIASKSGNYYQKLVSKK